LGPDPPPENLLKKDEIYRFLLFWGPSIEPEKASLKSASTANPPQKVKFMTFSNNSRPNLFLYRLIYRDSISPMGFFIKIIIYKMGSDKINVPNLGFKNDV
jgi:hypothetical protein